MFTKRDRFILSIILSACLVALTVPYLNQLLENRSPPESSFERPNGREINPEEVGLILPEIVPSGSEKIDVNSADAEEFRKLQGVGKVLARRIVNRRQDEGGYETLEELKKVDGVGKILLKRIKEKLEVG